MPKLKVERFTCPYADCIWPKCLVDSVEYDKHPSCSSAVSVKRMEILRRLALKPRKPRKVKST